MTTKQCRIKCPPYAEVRRYKAALKLTEYKTTWTPYSNSFKHKQKIIKLRGLFTYRSPLIDPDLVCNAKKRAINPYYTRLNQVKECS